MWTLKLTRPDGTTATIDGGDMTDVTVTQILTGVSRWSVAVPKSPSLAEWRFATATLRFDAGSGPQPIIRGRVVAVQTTESSAETTIRGKDRVEELRRPRNGENGIIFDVSNQTGTDAIRDFYGEAFFDDWATTVIEPTPTQVNDDLVVQAGSSTSELSDVFDLKPTDPFVIEADELRQSQSGFFRSAQNAERDGTTTVSRDDFEGGQGEQLSDISADVATSFELKHTIPSGEAVAAYRLDSIDGAHGELELIVDGQVVERVRPNALNAGVKWRTARVGIDVSGGNVKLDMTSTSGEVDLDALALVDNRFDHTFGESLNSNNRLAGPEKYPNNATLVASVADATWNIETARLEVAMNNLGGGQRLQVQFNDEWLPADGSEANTDFVATDNPGATSTVTARVRMDRFGSRDDATPTQGFERQTLSEWELRVDTNDVTVIEDETYTGSYFRVWKDLHDDANLVCVAEYDEPRELTTLQLGDETRPAEVIAVDADIERDTRKFANRLRGIGDDGDLEVEVTNQTAVDKAGEEIGGEPIVAPDETNSERLLSQVRNELAAAAATDRPSGTLDIEPRAIVPGFAYDLPEVGVEPVTEVSFSTESGQLRVGQPPNDLSGLLADLQVEIQNDST